MTLTRRLSIRRNRRGIVRALGEAVGGALAHVYHMEHDLVYLLEEVPSGGDVPPGNGLALREVPADDALCWSPELRILPRVTAARFEQGARRYAAIWKGQGVDVCWVVSGRCFHEQVDGFSLQLGPRDCYVFDYQGFRQGRPPAFGRFVLMKALVGFLIEEENQRMGGRGRFYSVVDRRNRGSVYFHTRVLEARLTGTFRTRWLLGRPTILLDGASPSIVVAQGNGQLHGRSS